MQINNYHHTQNLCFGAKFINKVPDFDVDLHKAGEIFEKLTKDYPDEKLKINFRKAESMGASW